MRGCPNSQSVSCQHCTSTGETIGKFAMSHGSLENWPIYRLVTRWTRGWKSRIESNPENYCALVHVVQVSLIHVDVNSNRGYIYVYMYIFFFRRICENSCEIALERFLSARDTCMFLWDLFQYPVDAHFEWPTL